MYHSILRRNAQQQLKKIGEAELVIGLPTYKNPKTAGEVARVALEGVQQHYPNLRTVLINADAGHDPTTRRQVMAQNGHHSLVVAGRYSGIRGQGNAIAALLDAALALDSRAIIILDSYNRTISPHWIAGLAHLVLADQADLVMPRYEWIGADSGLSNLIVYPLFRALWGWSLRHPAAPDFALAPRLATALLDEDIWGTEAAHFGLPAWLTTYAVLGRWRLFQSALGQKETDPAGLEKRFKAQFEHTVSVMLNQVYYHQPRWKEVEAFHSLFTLTQFAPPIKSTPALSSPDPTPLLDALALGWIEYRQLWEQILFESNLRQVERLAALPPEQFYFPADLWARIIYDFVVVFNKGLFDPLRIVRSLYPLYQGRLAAFQQEIAGLALVGREGTTAAQAVEFEDMRKYLKIRWHTYP